MSDYMMDRANTELDYLDREEGAWNALPRKYLITGLPGRDIECADRDEAEEILAGLEIVRMVQKPNGNWEVEA